jgi:hypothetical protein
MTKSIFLTIALMFTMMISKAQKNVYFTITHKLATANFAFNQTAQNSLMQDFKITRVDYYISSIKIIHDGGMEMAVPNKYILAKGSANVNELLGNFNVTNVEGIKFSIGVEAPINNADPSLQVAGTPLASQSPSMHWGWSSGYRFLALEGTTGAGFSTSFQMHGLGNANYFNQTKMVAGVPSGANDIYINLNADYTQALKGINISTGPIDHGVNATDLTALQNFRDFVFSPGTGIPTSIGNLEDKLEVRIYPNPTSDKLYIDFDNTTNNADMVVITDITGKIIFENSLMNSNEVNVSAYSKGIYVLKFYNKNAIVANRKIVIQ